jgi:hypothetical protein
MVLITNAIKAEKFATPQTSDECLLACYACTMQFLLQLAMFL